MRNDKERAKSRGSIGDEPDQVNDSIANIDELKLAESLPTIGVADSMNGDTSLVPVEEPRGAKRKTLHDGTTEREEL